MHRDAALRLFRAPTFSLGAEGHNEQHRSSLTGALSTQIAFGRFIDSSVQPAAYRLASHDASFVLIANVVCQTVAGW
jgi:hypothetical protein